MSEPTFPYGYARPPNGGPQGMGTMLTWNQMMTKKTVYNLHPEVRRRFHALIDYAHSKGVPLGVGTGWRVQPNPPPPGFAKPGNSWHESCPVSPTSATAFAIDTVPNVSWDWLGRNCAAYGLRVFTNVNNEPWHAQPIDIPTGRRYATTPPKIGLWDLPGRPTPPPPEEDELAAPAAVIDRHGNQWVFWKGANNQLMSRYAGDAAVDLGGIITDAIAANISGDTINVFAYVPNPKGALYGLQYSGGQWGSWYLVGG